MAAGNLKVGLWELARSASRRLFALSARRLLPSLTVSDLGSRRAGVRAQAVDRSGRLVDDFRIVGDGRTLHVLNAPSPGATSALAIGEAVARRASTAWDFTARS